MLKFGTGFDWMVTSTNATAAFAQWGWYGTPGGPAPGAMQVSAAGVGRFGGAGKALTITGSSVSSETTQASYLIPNSYQTATWFQGAAMYVPTGNAYMKPFIGVARNGTALITAALSTFGVIELWLGRFNKPLGTLLAQSAGGSYYNDTWNYIEVGGFLSSSASGYVTVRVNTVPVIQVVSTITQPTALQANSFMVGYEVDINVGGSATGIYWDDMYLTDDSGSLNNSWLGNIRCQAQVAASNSTPISWNPFPALTPNWQAASNTAVNDSLYVYTNIVNDYDLYNVTPIISSPEVFGVSVRGAYRQTDATQRSVANLISSNGTLVEGAEYFTPGTYTFSSDVFETDPDTGVQWLYTAVNLIKIGPKLKS